MKQTITNSILEKFKSLDRAERKKLLSDASARRQQLMRRLVPPKRARHDDQPDEIKVRHMPTLHDIALQILAEEHALAEESLESGDAIGAGEVIWTGLGRCHVVLRDEVIVCIVPPTFADAEGTMPAVGDIAEVRRVGHDLRVVSLHPRKTILSRPDPDGKRELVVAANVDLVVVVVSVVAPPLHPRILDRYLVAIQRGGAKPVIYVNKTDLLVDQANWEEELDKLKPYRALGIPIVLASALKADEGIQSLMEILNGKSCALVGHSGVGKSSTINALAPHLSLNTGDVSEGYGRGTHTTTASSLHDIGNGTRLIDTPGVRSFGIFDVSAAELPWYFPEFAQYVSDCKYRNCTHTHEPKCGVREASNRGEIARERYDAYLRMREEL